MRRSWQTIHNLVAMLPPGAHLTLRLGDVSTPPHVVPAFVRSSGSLHGQLADWRLPLDGKQGLHVREYSDRYEVHIDSVDPSFSVLRHNIVDFPPGWSAMAVAAGLLVGIPFGLGGMLLGAGFALGASILTSQKSRISLLTKGAPQLRSPNNSPQE